MADISAKDVKALRDATGAGMMDAKKALVQASGDMEAAKQILREKGLAKAGDRSDRENSEGAVTIVGDNAKVALVHLKAETDFSAKSDGFVSFVDKFANAVLVDGAEAATTALATEFEDLRLLLKENIEIGHAEVIEAADGNLLDTYIHLQDGRGKNAVVVEGSGIDADTLHQVALHIAFAKPTVLTRDEVPGAEVEAERENLLEITKAEGKPEQAWDKIVTGRMTAWFGERVLLDQGLHGDKVTVGTTIGDGTILRFAQAVVGA
ncbi:MAG: translation elongation factor Ts [Acidimicrobiales bacterium]